MRCTLSLAAILFALPLAAFEDKKPEAFDATKLVGNWTYVSGEKNGEKVTPEALKGQTAKIDKDKFTLKGEGGTFVMEYQLDTKKTPVTIKMKIVESPFGAGPTSEGIIELKGDELRLAYATEGGKPPTAFEAKKDSKHHYFILKRAK